MMRILKNSPTAPGSRPNGGSHRGMVHGAGASVIRQDAEPQLASHAASSVCYITWVVNAGCLMLMESFLGHPHQES